MLLLHKKRGTVTTRVDEKGRPTVYDQLPTEVARNLHSVGRLDLATTGLLILTNDTRLSDWLTDPRQSIRRTYLVTVRGELTADKITVLESGLRESGDWLRADQIELRKSSRRETHLVVHLSEGKNREIRRMFLAQGHEVTRLKRVAYGALELGELKPGAYRELSRGELLNAFPGAPLRLKNG